MAFGDIEDVKVVANRSPIGCVVVRTEYGECFPPANGNLCQEWEQVVRCATSIFADATAGVGTDRVEIAQDGGIKIRPGLRRIAD